MPEINRIKADLSGKRAAIYVGGAFKAFSLIKALRTLGMQVVLVIAFPPLAGAAICR